MKNELQVALRAKFPQLYEVDPDDDSAFALFGFEILDGWFELIDTLSSDLIRIAQSNGIQCPQVTQVKSKMGMLRFSLRNYHEQLDKVITEAEKRSTATCEQCGLPGKPYLKKRWVYVACDHHNDS